MHSTKHLPVTRHPNPLLNVHTHTTESNEGLVPPAVATHLMGKGGAFLLMLQLFLAVTSTGNSEQMAVASLFSYDVYRQYFNPQASNEKLLQVSRIMVGVYAGGFLRMLRHFASMLHVCKCVFSSMVCLAQYSSVSCCAHLLDLYC